MELKEEYRLVYMPGGGAAVDTSRLVQSVTISGRSGSPTRSLKAVLTDDGGTGHDRVDANPENGDQCIFVYVDREKEQHEMFRGLVMRATRGSNKLLTIEANDIGIYLSNNADTFSYENVTANAVFSDVCSRFGIPTGTVDSTGHVIPELVCSKSTAFDVIADALEQTYEATGERYALIAQEGKKNRLSTNVIKPSHWSIAA